jgi:hypothetical protein
VGWSVSQFVDGFRALLRDQFESTVHGWIWLPSTLHCRRLDVT